MLFSNILRFAKRAALLALAAIMMVPCASFAFTASAAEEAKNITAESNVQTTGFYNPPVVLDGNYNDYTNAYNGAVITASNNGGISKVYFILEKPAPEYTVEDTEKGTVHTFGNSGMIHELIDLKEKFGYSPKSIKITMDFAIAVDEIYMFSDGELPDWVQDWDKPLEQSDLLLLVSHSDDDQLFFAGLLPYYAGELGLKVQVAYFTNHDDVQNRRHELLDGLWHTGVRAYPIIAEFPDLYSESYDGAVLTYSQRGYTQKNFTDFVATLIENTKPLVVVSHDPQNGEYGHGTHMLCARTLMEVCNTATEPNVYGIGTDGKWKIAKVYFHLYQDNKIVLDIDSPLSAFGGKTAFQVSQDAFGYHKSQHWTWFYGWLYGTDGNEITKATEIQTHSPREYGLYSSAVGIDKEGGDLFENLETSKEKEERLAEESRKAESESIAEESRKAEESRRAEEESKQAAAEASSRAEQESIEKAEEESRREEESRLQAAEESREAEAAERTSSERSVAIIVLAAAMLAVVLLLAIQFKKH